MIVIFLKQEMKQRHKFDIKVKNFKKEMSKALRHMGTSHLETYFNIFKYLPAGHIGM